MPLPERKSRFATHAEAVAYYQGRQEAIKAFQTAWLKASQETGVPAIVSKFMERIITVSVALEAAAVPESVKNGVGGE